MIGRALLSLVLALAAGSGLAADYVVANSTCYGAAPLQPPATALLASHTYRVHGDNSATLQVRRRACGDGSTALYATHTALDGFYGAPGSIALVQNGVAYTPAFAADPMGCDELDSCGAGLPMVLPVVIGMPGTTMIAFVFSFLDSAPAFDDEQPFTLSIQGGYPIVATNYAIPASGANTPGTLLLDDAVTGTWWNPQRGGEGMTFDIGTYSGTRYLFFTWYTYAQGRGVFLSGSAALPATPGARAEIAVFQTSGAQFGNSFDPAQVVRSAVGTVTVERTGCREIRLGYAGSLGAAPIILLQPLWPHAHSTGCP